MSSSSGNEWNPAIAADANGHVTVAWDSYRNGNYDVFARTATGSSWGKEMAVAASNLYEAYPSIAYDPAGTLWVAYEEGVGAVGQGLRRGLESTGVPLYAGRAIRVRGFAKDGHAIETTGEIGDALPGAARRPGGGRCSRRRASGDWKKAQPDAWKKRGDNLSTAGPSYARLGPRNTMARLTVDGFGAAVARVPHQASDLLDLDRHGVDGVRYVL